MARFARALLFVLAVMAVSRAMAIELRVGGKKGWAVPSSSNSETYDQWAQRLRFHIGDILQFEYPAKQDSVLVVTREAFEKCDTSAPLASYDDGKTSFKFDRSGPFYFVSGAQGHCEKGQKLIVVVMAQGGGRNRGNASAPSIVAASPSVSFGNGEGPAATPLAAPALAPTAGSANSFSSSALSAFSLFFPCFFLVLSNFI